MTALIVFGSIFMYFTMAGFLGVKTHQYWWDTCHSRSDSIAMRNLSAIFWPIALPMFLGAGIAKFGNDNGEKKQSKAEKRQAAELEEAKHRVKVAELKHQENSWLDKQLEAGS